MTPDEQRIAIAEACGWHSFKRITYDDGRTLLWGMSKDMKSTTLPTMLVPDYLNDLNAVQEASVWLQANNPKAYWDYHSFVSPRYGCDATAAQRAEAFLCTIGKWRNT